MPPKPHDQQHLPGATSSSSSSPSSPFSWHSNHRNERFFSSLRQVEERLASEDSCSRPSSAAASSPPQQRKNNPAFSALLTSSDKSSESPPPSPSASFSAPLFVDHRCRRGRHAQPHLPDCSTAAGPLLQDSSPDLPPLELFSDSLPRESSPSSLVGSPPPQYDASGDDLEGYVERLMGLLGLSESYQEGGAVDGGWSSIDGDQDHGGFLSKIAGVKGPKCRKEVERLDGWIRHYRSRGVGAAGKRKPARVEHLLLARAACNGGSSDGAGVRIGFPATVEEYLQHDPPVPSFPP